MKRVLDNWPKLVLIFVPLTVAAIATAVIISEQSQPLPQQAIRLVKESRSRKENFTVQQYLYTTVYHRRDKGENVTIAGWRARQDGDTGPQVVVEFVYSDETGEHAAAWSVDMNDDRITPQNQEARNLSWR